MQFSWQKKASKESIIRFALINSSSLFRQGVKLALQSMGDYELVQEAATPSEFRLRMPAGGEPMLVIMAMDAYETDEQIRSKPFSVIHPDAAFLITYWDTEYDKMVNMIRNGARGFCKTTDDPTVFHNAISAILKDGYYFNHVLTPQILREVNKG